MLWTVLLVIVLLIAAFPFWLESRKPKIGKAARKGAPGHFARLSQGVTYYRWIGPVRGPVAVMIHGLSTPSVVFNEVAEGMGSLGYRVLVYDLYGRGLSDAARGQQNRAFFLEQLTDLLEDQGLSDDLTLVGYSMGASIATAFAATNPHRMKRLIMLAAAGVVMRESKFSAFCRSNPIIGEWVHGMFAAGRMRQSVALTEAQGLAASAQLTELSRQGYLPAILSSRRGMLAEVQEKEHRAISRDDIPVVAIWGDKDDVVPITALGVLAQWNRVARQEVIKGAGHGLPHSHGLEVIKVLRDVFREN